MDGIQRRLLERLEATKQQPSALAIGDLIECGYHAGLFASCKAVESATAAVISHPPASRRDLAWLDPCFHYSLEQLRSLAIYRAVASLSGLRGADLCDFLAEAMGGKPSRSKRNAGRKVSLEQEETDRECFDAWREFSGSVKKPCKVAFGEWLLESRYDIGLSGAEAYDRAEAYRKRNGLTFGRKNSAAS